MSEEIGLTCVYKDGEAKYLEGDAVTKAYADGWKDTPQPKVTEEPVSEPEPTEAAAEPEPTPEPEPVPEPTPEAEPETQEPV